MLIHSPSAPRIITPNRPKIIPATKIPRDKRSWYDKWIEQERLNELWQMAPSLIASVSSLSDATSYTTGSATPSDGMLYLVSMHCKTSGITAGTPSFSGTGVGTFVSVGSRGYDTGGTPQKRIEVFRAVVSGATAGTFTMDFSGVTQIGCAIHVISVPGAVTTGTNGSNSVVQVVTPSAGSSVPSISATLATFTDATNNVGIMAAGHAANETTTKDTNWTALGNTTIAGPNCALLTQYIVGGSDLTVDASWATASNAGCMAFEVAMTVSSGAKRLMGGGLIGSGLTRRGLIR